MARYYKTNINLLSNLSQAYRKAHPTDEMGNDLREDITLSHVLTSLIDGKEIYDTIFKNGECDSIVRERVFEMLSKASGLPYDTIYNLWLKR